MCKRCVAKSPTRRCKRPSTTAAPGRKENTIAVAGGGIGENSGVERRGPSVGEACNRRKHYYIWGSSTGLKKKGQPSALGSEGTRKSHGKWKNTRKRGSFIR